MKHDWARSTLGHGELMCRRCCMTNREATALGRFERCEPIETPPNLAKTGLLSSPGGEE